jgi:exodeoxyribonuclease-3
MAWSNENRGKRDQKMLKIASWNVNSLNVRLPLLLAWTDGAQPDILALQETKLPNERFPTAELAAAGYQSVCSGQPTYNGVAILSREPASDIVTDIPGLDDPQRRILAATIPSALGAVRIVDLYVVNGSEVGSEKFAYKLNWLEKVTDWLAQETRQHENLVVLGDFNIAPDDRDVHDPDEWREKVLCSTPERKALKRILELGLNDTFRLFEQAENIYSWWDYRMNAFRRKMGLRIDLLLASQRMASHCSASYVDIEPRRQERPSDHAPVVAEFVT